MEDQDRIAYKLLGGVVLIVAVFLFLERVKHGSN